MELLSACSDYIFKKIFADERNIDCLKSFLQAVLGFREADFRGLQIIDPFLQKESAEDKLAVLDVKLKTAGGGVIDIEVQLWNVPDMRSRITYYLSNMITEQLGAGGQYGDIRRAISIVVVDFPLIHESESHQTVFQMRERAEGFPFNDLMEIDVLDLTKIPKNESSDLVNWMKFLKAKREEEFEMLAQTNPAINQAYAVLRELSEDEATRLRYEARLKAQRDEWSRVAGARLEGQEEGHAKGHADAMATVIRKMANKGVAPEMIANYLDLSVPEVSATLRAV